MGESEDGLGLSLSLGLSQLKEPSLGLGLNLLPLRTSSFSHMHNHNNNHLQKKIYHNSWPHQFQSSGNFVVSLSRFYFPDYLPKFFTFNV